ncbi:MAG: hypothetical protein KBH11_09140 [Bacteroidia bacterium]|nr:hypothetical protein [Bacteroidota bacterium]MBK7391316.1 hypothetical protein [Bacteroidota bacterium]MBP9083228.1 hypothetical protein [Bacteroidia bacterium]
MKKAGLFLRMGFVAIAATILSTAAFAQDNAKKPGRKDVPTRVATPVVKAKVISHQKPAQARQQGVVRAKLDPKLAAQKRGAVASTQQGTGARNCTPKVKANAYSIKRADFNRLPKDRQQFVLNHSDKYTIVD